MNKFISTITTVILFLVSPFFQILHSNQITQNKEIKILVLIIASDELPVYCELQNIWRSYMHNDPQHVEAYFIKGNPQLSADIEIHDDIIWSKMAETWIPGILNKTLISMEAVKPRLHEFDYVLRTNLSSFYIFPRLLKFLQNCPRNNFYCAVEIPGYGSGSGAGFLMSSDVVELLIQNKSLLWNNVTHPDDVIIGLLLKYRGIKLVTHKRVDYLSIDSWNRGKDTIPEDVFQFRIKNMNDNLRSIHDIIIHKELLNMFYNTIQ